MSQDALRQRTPSNIVKPSELVPTPLARETVIHTPFKPDTAPQYLCEQVIHDDHLLTIHLEAFAETERVEDAFPEADQHDTVYELIDNYDTWGHGTYCVTATLSTTGQVPRVVGSGKAYLGSCSYAGPADFLMPNGYYPQMREEALDALDESHLAEELRGLLQTLRGKLSSSDFASQQQFSHQHLESYFQVKVPDAVISLESLNDDKRLRLDMTCGERNDSWLSPLSKRTSRTRQNDLIQQVGWAVLQAANSGSGKNERLAAEHAMHASTPYPVITLSEKGRKVTLGPADVLYLAHADFGDSFKGHSGSYLHRNVAGIYLRTDEILILARNMLDNFQTPRPQQG